MNRTITSVSILFYGPQGCGKSFFAEACLGEFKDQMRLGFACPNGAKMVEKPGNLAHVFDTLTRFEEPFVLIEDVELLFKDLRSMPADRRRLIDTLAGRSGTFMIIATTRYPEHLLQEEIRAFTHVLPILYPNDDDRHDLITTSVTLPQKLHRRVVKHTRLWSTKEILDFAKKIDAGSDESMVNRLLKEHCTDIDTSGREKRMEQLVKFTQEYCAAPQIQNNAQKKIPSALAKKLYDALELKPGMFGIGIDIKELLRPKQ